MQAWTVVMEDGFLPDFNIVGKMQNVYQIHSDKRSAEKLVKKINDNIGDKLWFTVPCTITYNLPL